MRRCGECRAEGCFVWAGGTADRSASQGAVRRVCHARESRPVGLRGSNGDSLPPRGVQGWARLHRASRSAGPTNNGKAYCGGRDVLGRRASRHAGVPMGRPERRGARTAAKRLRSRLRRRSISIGPLSWANERLVLRRLSRPLSYSGRRLSTRALATRRPSQAADIMPPAPARAFAAGVEAGFGLERQRRRIACWRLPRIPGPPESWRGPGPAYRSKRAPGPAAPCSRLRPARSRNGRCGQLRLHVLAAHDADGA